MPPSREAHESTNRSLRWSIGAILAAGLGAAAVAIGRLGAMTSCGGPCPQLEGATALAQTPIGGSPVTAGIAAAVALGVLLWPAISSRPLRLGTGIVSLVGLGFIGALLARAPSPASPPPAEAPAADTPTAALPACPDGTFRSGEACAPCTETMSVPEAAGLFFAPMQFEATWKYANDRAIVRGAAGEAPVDDLTIEGNVSPGGQAVCASGAILVVGSASSDGPLARNEARAAARAARLASHVAKSCAKAPPVFALSFGQSRAAADAADDRALTIIGLDTPDGTPVTAALIERELGYVLDSGVHGSALLARHANFPAAGWRWVKGGQGTPTVTIAPRPFSRVDMLRDDAPPSCLG